ncbi:GNAT family N-acetyltransferase [Burkholderia sola]
MHADPDVTAWLARGPMSIDEAGDVIARFDAHVDAHGFGAWAVERRADALLVGVCGLSYEARATHPMAPCVEIMWRQARHAWGHGYMGEAAAAALADGFDRIGLGEIFAWTADTNLRSQQVMQRLDMLRQPARDFDRPALPEGHALRRHVVYVARSPAAAPACNGSARVPVSATCRSATRSYSRRHPRRSGLICPSMD